jgi:hypothetical protein
MIGDSETIQVDGLSLALIGSASAHEGWGEDVQLSRGAFDKETRRKPLAFAADAGYGDCMPVLNCRHLR